MSAPGPALPGMRWLRELGSGGFADVHLYERDQPRIKVAVKLLRIDKVTDAERRQFTAEADAMAELQEHPYIVSVLWADAAPDGRPYLVMNYYPGPDLLQQVATKPLSVADALRTGIKLAGAVETAHRAGIVHRDIKPANVLMSSYGEPGLSDFGIAGRDGGTEEDDQIGVSIPWSAPEVITGQSNGSIASDVYSLASTIWHLLAGRSPFSVPGDNGVRQVTARVLHSPAPSIGRTDVPASLDRLLQQALAKQPQWRPQSAMQLGRLLQGVEQDLRLARTAIIVPDAGLSPAAASPSPGPGGPGHDEATLLKRPVPVRAGPRQELRSVPARHVARSASAPQRRAAQPESTDLTERRPQVVEVEPRTEPTSAPRRWLPVAITAALVGVAAAVAVVLASRGTDAPPPPLSSPPAASTASDVLSGDVPVVPEIVGTSKGSEVVFTTSAPKTGEHYEWLLAPVGGSMRPIAGSADKNRIKVAIDPSGSTCVKLKVTRDGAMALGDRCVP